jgi:hypothetical protein
MIDPTTKMEDLTLPNCYPNCETCHGLWTNETLNHKIVCLCCKSLHKNRVRGPKPRTTVKNSLMKGLTPKNGYS